MNSTMSLYRTTQDLYNVIILLIATVYTLSRDSIQDRERVHVRHISRWAASSADSSAACQARMVSRGAALRLVPRRLRVCVYS